MTFNLDITRLNCWEGAFTGKGMEYSTEVPQIITANGTYSENGDIVFVLCICIYLYRTHLKYYALNVKLTDLVIQKVHFL